MRVGGGGPSRVLDASGNDYHGDAYNGADTVDDATYGMVGNVDGIDDRVDFPSINVTGAITIAGFVRWGVVDSALRAVLAKIDNGDNAKKSFYIGTYWGVIRAALYSSAGENLSKARHSSTAPSVGTRYHVGFTWSGVGNANLDVYLNGALDNGPSYPSTFSASQSTTEPVQFGCRMNGGSPGNFSECQSGDWRIYDAALSASEMLALSNQSGQRTSNLVAHWPMNEAAWIQN